MLQAGKPKRAKKCPVCRGKFQPVRPMQPCCDDFECKVAMAERAAQKSADKRRNDTRKADQARREKLMTHGDWVAAVQIAFNAFIRLRDAGRPCIDCGKPIEPSRPGGSADAGHYRSRGSAPHLRFVEDNCHVQRKNCNRPGGATHAAYRAGLIAKIGLERVEALESDNEPRKWTIEELKAIKAHYKKKTKELQCQPTTPTTP